MPRGFNNDSAQTLTEKEKEFVMGTFVNMFKKTDHFVTGSYIAKRLNSLKLGKKRNTDVTVRAFVNYARQNKVPIISTSKGYMYTEDKKLIQETIQQLLEREGMIRKARIGLEESLEMLQTQNQEKLL